MKDLNLEKAVLGALLIDPSCTSIALPILREQFFTDRSHQIIFRCLVEMYKKSEPIDTLTMVKELKRIGRLEDVGGAYFVSTLTNQVASGGNIEFHARVLTQHYITRELHDFGIHIQQQAQIPSTDCFDLLASLSKKVSDLSEFTSTNMVNVGQLLGQLYSEIRDVQTNGKPLGILTGMRNLDEYFGGWQKSAFYVLAARPGMGKTAFALQAAKHPAMQGIPTAFFSLEMSGIELAARLASSEARVNSTAIGQRSVTPSELMHLGANCQKLADAPLYIDDTAGLRVSDLKAKARRLYYDYGVRIIFVDYLQLMHGDERGNREQEISYISRNLKGLAKELNIPVIALSQLSRAVEQEPEKRPRLSHLRESGSIEQDADGVAFLWRPAEYDLFPQGYDWAGNLLLTDNLCILDWGKARGFKKGEVPLQFFGEYMTMCDYPLRGTSMEVNSDFLNG